MSVPARDEVSRLDIAQQRLASALNRLEGALANPIATVSDSTSGGFEDSEKLTALLVEVAELRQDNNNLEGANAAALVRVEETIARLKSVLAA